MKTVALLSLAMALPGLAAIDGTVVNGTSGQPQPNVIVSLLQPGESAMTTLATTKSDAAGKFHFDRDPQGPRILQAIYRGVIYNQVAPPGTAASNLTVEVYEPTSKAGTAQLAQHLVILEPGDGQLEVSENFVYQNATKTTFNDPERGSALVFVPEGGRASVKAAITAPGGMPIRRGVEKTRQDGVYKVDYPLKPGETRFEVTYAMPAAKPMMFSGRVLEAGAPTRVVVPSGVTLKGGNLESLGQEPTTQAGIYNVKGESYQFEIEGTGSMTPPQADTADSGMPQIQQAPPPVYNRLWLILGLILGILALGAFLLWRRDGAEER